MIKPRKPIASRSAAGRRIDRIYAAMKLAWREKYPLCLPCKRRWQYRNWTDDVHHLRGVAGTLKIDQRFWIPVCRACHVWIEANKADARTRGWLCANGEFNSPPRDAESERLANLIALAKQRAEAKC